MCIVPMERTPLTLWFQLGLALERLCILYGQDIPVKDVAEENTGLGTKKKHGHYQFNPHGADTKVWLFKKTLIYNFSCKGISN